MDLKIQYCIRLLACSCVLFALACGGDSDDAGNDTGATTEIDTGSNTESPDVAFDDTDETDDAGTSDGEDITQPEPDVESDTGNEEKDSAPPPCKCGPTQHCNADDKCEDDLCVKGASTCNDESTALKVCSEDGSGFELVPCEEGSACFVGQCVEKICNADDPPTCEGAKVKYCNSLGTAFNFSPCPGGMGCQNGKCMAVQPNVILLLDTSGSMNYVDEAGSMPEECTGDNCPSWSWPDACDNPDTPMTRLGKAKKALTSVIESDKATELRLALQRFPQIPDILLGAKAGSCASGGLKGLTYWTSKELAEHTIPEDKFQTASMTTVFATAFTKDGSSNSADMMSWIDFKESYEFGEKSCTLLPLGCPGDGDKLKACLNDTCAIQTEAELRANGQTPIGRSLFYAGEYLRHAVVVEGKNCGADADCGSPHYTCVDKKCHDPFRLCRPNLIVVFTDGGESADTWADEKKSSSAFFHPRVQAKRLHYGLGCQSDADCLNGAKCASGVCNTPGTEIEPKVCHLTSVPCENNIVCKEYKFKQPGGIAIISGQCESTGLDFVDTKASKNVLRDPAGTPIGVTVHVVDAADSMTGNSLIAAMGGGKHVPVDFANVSSIVDAFLPLLDIKTSIGGCE